MNLNVYSLFVYFILDAYTHIFASEHTSKD